eukprot:244158-Rhodomonas_salina.2
MAALSHCSPLAPALAQHFCSSSAPLSCLLRQSSQTRRALQLSPTVTRTRTCAGEAAGQVQQWHPKPGLEAMIATLIVVLNSPSECCW